MVYNGFPFFNELELLEIRLEELWGVVDYFILVEATETHSGNPKPLYFSENKQHFGKYLSKIIHVVIKDFPVKTPWGRESDQRRFIIRGISPPNEIPDDNDIFIIQDADEIPKAYPILLYKNNNMDGIRRIPLKLYHHYLNTVHEHNKVCDCTVIMRWKDVKNHPDPFQGAVRGSIKRKEAVISDNNGGWHFSYLGGAERIKYKLQSFAHQELNTARIANTRYITERISSGKDVYRGGIFIKTTGDELPQAIIKYPQKYAHLML